MGSRENPATTNGAATVEWQNFEQLAQDIEALDTYWGPTFRLPDHLIHLIVDGWGK